MQEKQRVISFIVSNQPGVLCRVAGLISRRGFNIESLTVGVTSNPELSRITIVMFAEDEIIEQVIKQLDKLLDVKAIMEIPEQKGVMREIALVKARTVGNSAGFMDDVASLFGIVLDVGNETTTVQLTGTISYINEGIKKLRKYDIIEVARTGMVALERGDEQLFDSKAEANK